MNKEILNKMKGRQLVLLLLTTLLCSSIHATLIVQTEEKVYTFLTVTMHFFNQELQEFRSEPYVVNASSFFVYRTDEGSPEGKIVFMENRFGVDDAARSMERMGAVGVIMGSDVFSPGRSNDRFSQPRVYVNLPTAEIEESDYDALVEGILMNETVLWMQMTSTPAEDNPYYGLVTTVSVVYQIITGVMFGSLIVVSAALFILEVRANGRFIFQVKSLLLIVLFFANLYRFLVTVIDPLGAHRYFHWMVPVFGSIINVPVLIITELMVSLYWFEAMAPAVTDTRLLGSTKIPFIGIIIFFILNIAILAVLAVASPIFFLDFIRIVAIIYMVCLLALAIFHVVVGRNLYLLVQKINKKARLKRNSQIFIIKVLLISSTDFLLFLAIVWVIFVRGLPIIFGILPGLTLYVISGIHTILTLTLFHWKSTSQTVGSSTVRDTGDKKGSTRKTVSKSEEIEDLTDPEESTTSSSTSDDQ